MTRNEEELSKDEHIDQRVLVERIKNDWVSVSCMAASKQSSSTNKKNSSPGKSSGPPKKPASSPFKTTPTPALVKSSNDVNIVIERIKVVI